LQTKHKHIELRAQATENRCTSGSFFLFFALTSNAKDINIDVVFIKLTLYRIYKCLWPLNDLGSLNFCWIFG